MGVRWDARDAAVGEGSGGETESPSPSPSSGEQDEEEEEWTNSSDLGAGFAALLVDATVLLDGFGLVLARRSRRTAGVGCVDFLSFCAAAFGFSTISFVGLGGDVGALPVGLTS